jgi:hypothetical protein
MFLPDAVGNTGVNIPLTKGFDKPNPQTPLEWAVTATTFPSHVTDPGQTVSVNDQRIAVLDGIAYLPSGAVNIHLSSHPH